MADGFLNYILDKLRCHYVLLICFEWFKNFAFILFTTIYLEISSSLWEVARAVQGILTEKMSLRIL